MYMQLNRNVAICEYIDHSGKICYIDSYSIDNGLHAE